jgi:hypothetical protein
MTEPLRLGDLEVLAPHLPGKVMKALAVMAAELHPAFGRQPLIEHGDKSKESCVLCSLTVRDFLRAIDIPARVREVCVVMIARRGPAIVHSLGIGAPDKRIRKEPGRWNGHMVVLIPSCSLLIDTTLYPSIRPQWPMLPPMVAIPYERPAGEAELYGLRSIAGIRMQDEDFEFAVSWLDHPANRHPPDGDAEPRRRAAVVAHLVARFGRWRDAA